MNPNSRAFQRLQNMYRGVLRRMRFISYTEQEALVFLSHCRDKTRTLWRRFYGKIRQSQLGHSNGHDEAPYWTLDTLEPRVLLSSTPVPGTEIIDAPDVIIVDNIDAGFNATGWSESGAEDEYQGSSVSRDTADSAATWTIPIQQAAMYEVYAWWSGQTSDGLSIDRDDAAAYTVRSSMGQAQNSIVVDQTQQQGQWNLLDTFYFTDGDTVTVELRSSGTGAASADAIKLIKKTDALSTVVVDNLDYGFSQTGTWSESTAVDEWNNSSLYTTVGGNTAQWQTHLAEGKYEVFTWWSSLNSSGRTYTRDPFAQFSITHADGATDIVVDQNQNYGQWFSLGSYTFNDLQDAQVVLTYSAVGEPSSYASADAVKFVMHLPPTAVNDTWAWSVANNSFDVSANDTTYVDGDGSDITEVVEWSDGQYGTVLKDIDGHLIYQPNDPNWWGTDTFTYKIGDGVVISASAEVKVIVDHPNHLIDQVLVNNGNLMGPFPPEDYVLESEQWNTKEGETFHLSATWPDATASHSASIDWGDGVVQNNLVFTGSQMAANHAYNDSGLYEVTLSIHDGQDVIDTFHFSIMAEEQATLFPISYHSVGVEDDLFELNVTISDPGSGDDDIVKSMIVHWGDGATSVGFRGVHWTLDDQSWDVSHRYLQSFSSLTQAYVDAVFNNGMKKRIPVLLDRSFGENGIVVEGETTGGGFWNPITYTDNYSTEDIEVQKIFAPDGTNLINFNTYSLLSYAGQDLSGSAVVADSGATLEMSGNTWKALDLNYNITANTVIEFDFSSDNQGEIHGLGFDSDLNLSDDKFFKLYGTQNWGLTDFENYSNSAPGVKHYVIPVGQFFTGQMQYLFFTNDHDAANPTATSTFSNFKIYNEGQGVVIDQNYWVLGSLDSPNGEDEDHFIMLSRFNKDGLLDTSFGNDGISVLDFWSDAYGVAIEQYDGKLYIAGNLNDGTGSKLLWASFDLETETWDYRSTVVDDILLNDVTITDMAIVDGKMILSGSAMNTNGHEDFFLAKYDLSTGNLDTSFADGIGYLSWDYWGGTDSIDIINDIEIQVDESGSSHKILIAGEVDGKFAVARYHWDGSLDTSFASGGFYLADPGLGNAVATSVISYELPDNQLVIAAVGTTDDPRDPDYYLIRLDNQGRNESTFNSNSGFAIADFSSDTKHGFATDLAVAPDGKLVVGGYAFEFAVDQYESSILNPSYYSRVNTGDDYTVARFTQDGQIDVDFADNGLYGIDLSYGDDVARQVIIEDTGKIIVAGHDRLLAMARHGITVLSKDASLAVSVDNKTLDEGQTLTYDLFINDPQARGPFTVTVESGSIDSSMTQNQWYNLAGSASLSGSVTYQDNGVYNLIYQVEDSAGNFYRQQELIIVGNVAPEVTVSGPTSVLERTEYQITFSATDVGLDTIESWTIDWGDGIVESLDGVANNAIHQYMAPGQNTIKLWATDEDGTHGPVEFGPIDVTDVAPNHTIWGNATVNEGENYELILTRDMAEEASDPMIEWEIDWGDGSALEIVSPESDRATHVYADGLADGSQNYTITVNAIHQSITRVVGTHVVTVNDVPLSLSLTGDDIAVVGVGYVLELNINIPDIDAIASWTVDWGDGVVEPVTGGILTKSHIYNAISAANSITVTATDDDGNIYTTNLSKTIEIVTGPVAVHDQVYIPSNASNLDIHIADDLLSNDLSTSTLSILTGMYTQPEHGTLTFNGTQFTYTPDVDFHNADGQDSFTYWATDGSATTDPVTVNILYEVNPSPKNDFYVFDRRQPIIITDPALGLLANDYNPNQDNLTVDQTGSYSFEIAYPYGSIDNEGELIVNSDGTFEYFPHINNIGFFGTIDFKYKITLANSQTSVEGSVEIVVRNNPAQTNPISYNILHGETLDTNDAAIPDLLSFAFDPDVSPGPGVPGDILKVFMLSNPIDPTDPERDIVDDLSFNSETGNFQFKPVSDFVGTAAFNIYYTDDDYGSRPRRFAATVEIEVTNTPPIAVGDDYELIHDTTLDANLLANDINIVTDNENDILTIEIRGGNTNLPEGFVFDTEPGHFTYVPPVGYTGFSTFEYRISDGVEWSDYVTVTLSVTNQAPTAIGDVYTFHGNQPHAIDVEQGLLANDTDLDSDTLTIEKLSDPAHGVLTLLQAGDGSLDGSFTYDPVNGYVGDDLFTYRISDGLENSHVVTVRISVTNNAPVGVTDFYEVSHNKELEPGTSSSVIANDLDSDDDILAINLLDGPSHALQFALSNTEAGKFNYKPDPTFVGRDRFTYELTDGIETTGPITVWIDVTNDVPVAVDKTYSFTEGQSFSSPDSILDGVADADEDMLEVELVTNAVHGDVSLNSDGSFTYTPNDSDFFGVDQFAYQIKDNLTSGGIGYVKIDVENANDIPVSPDLNFSTTLDTPLIMPTGTLLAEAIDPDSENLTVTLITSPSKGTLENNQVGLDGSFHYIPGSGSVGQGNDSFQIRISDGIGQSSLITVTINIAANTSPDAITDHYFVTANSLNTIPVFNGVLTNDTDPEDNDLTAIETSSNSLVTLNSDGSFTYNAGAVGTDSFTYITHDEYGLSSTAVTVNLSIVSASSTVGREDHYTLRHLRTSDNNGVAKTISAKQGLLANDSGIAGFSVTQASAPSANDIDSFQLNADGSFTIQASPSFEGELTFEYNIVDSNNNIIAQNIPVTIEVTNYKPVSNNDTYRVLYTEDGNGQPSWIAIDSTKGVLVNDYDHDGDWIISEIDSLPATGNLQNDTINANGSFQFKPVYRQLDSYSFSYRVHDGAEYSHSDRSGTVTLEVYNNRPVAGADNYYVHYTQVSQDASLSGNVMSNDYDPDGDSLTVALSGNGATSAGGTVTLSSSGDFEYVAPQGFVGTDTFVYELIDYAFGNETHIFQTVTIEVWNHIPEVSDDYAYVKANREGESSNYITGNVLNNDMEWDGDQPEILTLPVAGSPLEMSSDGSFTFTPDPEFVGPFVFSYRVTDGWQHSSFATLTIDVRNHAPHAIQDVYIAPETGALTENLLTNDFDYDTDDQEHLKISGLRGLYGETVAQVANGFELQSNGQTVLTVSEDGAISYTAAQFNGTYAFEYWITDGVQNSSSALATIYLPGRFFQTVDDLIKLDDTFASSVSVFGNDIWVGPSGMIPVINSHTGNEDNGVTINADGTISFQPEGTNFNGSVTVEYTASFGDIISTAEVTLIYEKAPGGAGDDIYLITYDVSSHTFTGNVQDNDIIPDGLNWYVRVDGQTNNNPVVLSHGTITLATDGSFTYTYDDKFYGTDSFLYDIYDDNDNIVIGNVSVELIVSLPIIESYQIDVINVLEADLDNYGAIDIPIAALLNTETSKLGPDSELRIVVDDAQLRSDSNYNSYSYHGQVAYDDDSITYSPDGGYDGQDSLVYRIENIYDDKLHTPWMPLTLDVTLLPKVSMKNDIFTFDEGDGFDGGTETQTLDVLANDIPDGDVASFGSIISIALVSQSHGHASISGTQITYTPVDSDWHGSDEITYEVFVNGVSEETATAKVLYRAVNDLPEAIISEGSTNQELEVDEDSYVTFDVSDHITDVDEKDQFSNGKFMPQLITIDTQPQHGKLELSGTQFTYFPDPNYSGADSFTYIAYDNTLDDNTEATTVDVDVIGNTTVKITSSSAPDGYSSTVPVIISDGTTTITHGISVRVEAPEDSVYHTSYENPISGNFEWENGQEWISISVSHLDTVNVSFGGGGKVTLTTVEDNGNGITVSVSGGYLDKSKDHTLKVLWSNSTSDSLTIDSDIVDMSLQGTFNGNLTITADQVTSGIAQGKTVFIKAYSVDVDVIATEAITTLEAGTLSGSVSAGTYIHWFEIYDGDLNTAVSAEDRIEYVIISGSLTSTGSVTADKNGSTADGIGNIYVNGGDIAGNITSKGTINSITATGDLTGIVLVTGNEAEIKSVDLGGELSGTLKTTGTNGNIGSGTINIMGGINNATIDASGKISYIQSERGINNSTIKAGKHISSIYVRHEDLDATITAGNYIENIICDYGSISGSITSSGVNSNNGYGITKITTRWAGGDINASIDSTGTINTISASRDIASATINTGDNINIITAGRDFKGAVTIDENLGTVTVAGEMLPDLIVGGYINSIDVEHSLSGLITVKGTDSTNGESIHAIEVGHYYDSSMSGIIFNATITTIGHLNSLSVTGGVGYGGMMTGTTLNVANNINTIDVSLSILNSTISAGGNIGYVNKWGTYGVESSLDEFAPDSGILNTTISATNGLIEKVIATYGSLENVTITAEQINKVDGTYGVAGQSTITSTVGAIDEIKSEQGDIDATIDAKTNINSITATNGSINGTIKAGSEINTIEAGAGIGASIDSGGDINSITAGQKSYGVISGAIKAKGNIGAIKAFSGGQFSDDFHKSSETAGDYYKPDNGPDIKMPGSDDENYIPNVGDLDRAFADKPAKADAGLPDPSGSIGGSITGNITVDGIINELVSYGTLEGAIKTLKFSHSVWALGSISSDITIKKSVLKAYSWNDISGTLNAVDNVITKTYGNMEADVKNASSLTASAWGKIDIQNIDVTNGIQLWSADSILANTLKAGNEGISLNSWGAADSSMSKAVSLDTTGPMTAKAQEITVQDVSSDVSIHVLSHKMTKQEGKIEAETGILAMFSGGDITGTGSYSAKKIMLVAGGNILGSAGALDLVYVSALGDVNMSKLTSSRGDITVQAKNITISKFKAKNVELDAIVNLTASGDGIESLNVHSGGKLTTNTLNSTNGSILVDAFGDVHGSFVGKYGVGITSWGDVSGDQILSQKGAVAVTSYGSVSNHLTAEVLVNVSTYGRLTSAIVSFGGVQAFARETISGNIDANYNVTAESWGDITGYIEAGRSIDQVNYPGEYGAYLVAHGKVTNDVTASHHIEINAEQGITGLVTATAGHAYLSTSKNVEKNITAGQDIRVVAGNITSTNITSNNGSIELQTIENTKTIASASESISIITGTVAEVETKLTSAGGSIEIAAGTQISKATIDAPDATVNITSGANATVKTTGEVAPRKLNVSAFGTLTADVTATHNISLVAKDDIKDASVTTESADSFIEIYTAKNISGTFTSGNDLDVVALEKLDGTYKAGEAYSGSNDTKGNLTLTTLKETGSLTATAHNQAEITSMGKVSGTVTTTIGDIHISALTDVDATITAGHSAYVTAVEGSVKESIFAQNGDAEVFAGKEVNGGILANQNAKVSTSGDINNFVVTFFGNITLHAQGDVLNQVLSGIDTYGWGNIDIIAQAVSGTIHSKGNTDILALNDVTSPITAGGQVSVSTTGNVTGTIDAGSDVNVTTSRQISGNIEAGGSAIISAGANISAPIDAVGSVVFTTNSDASSSILSREGIIEASIFGNFTGSMSAPDNVPEPGIPDIYALVFGNATGPINAKQDIKLLVGGNFDATLTSLEANAQVTALGSIAGQINAGGLADLVSYDSITANINAGSTDVTSMSDITITNITTATGMANLSAFETINVATITSAGDIYAQTMQNATFGAITAGYDVHITTNSSLIVGDLESQHGAVFLNASGRLATLDAHVTADQQAVLTSTGSITGSASSTNKWATINAIGAIDLFDISDSPYGATLSAGGDIVSLTSTEATGNVKIATNGSITNSTIYSPTLASVFAVGTIDNITNITSDQDVQIFVGQDSQINIHANNDAMVAALGDVTLKPYNGASGNLSVMISGDLYSQASSPITATGDISVITLGSIFADLEAGGKLSLLAAEDIESDNLSGQTAKLKAYRNIDATLNTTSDIDSIWARGDILGSFTATGSNIDNVFSYEDISADFSATSINQVMAWGNIEADASFQTTQSINEIRTGRLIDSQAQIVDPSQTVQLLSLDHHIFSDLPGDFQLVVRTDPNDPELFSFERLKANIADFNRSMIQAEAELLLAETQAEAAQSAQETTTAQSKAMLAEQLLDSRTAAEHSTAHAEQIMREMFIQSADALALMKLDARSDMDAGKIIITAENDAMMMEIQLEIDNLQQTTIPEIVNAQNKLFVELQKAAQDVADLKEKLKATVTEANAQRLEDWKVEWEKRINIIANQLFKAIEKSALDYVQQALDWASWVIGPLDLVNSFISYVRGNTAEAAMYGAAFAAGLAVGFIPAVGAAARGVVKVSFKAMSKTAGKVVSKKLITRSFATVGKTLMKTGKEIRWLAAWAKEHAGDIAEHIVKGACFVAGTQVLVDVDQDGDGQYETVNIEDIQVGDWVLSRDQFDSGDDVERKQVTAVFERTTDHLQIVTILDADGNIETIRTTGEHPFWVTGVGWVQAGELQVGMKLNEADDSNNAVIISNIRELHPQGITVYNFEVAGDHTYFVEDGQGDQTALWVHNRYNPLRKALGLKLFDNKFAAHVIPVGKFFFRKVEVRKSVKQAHALLKKYHIDINGWENGFVTECRRHMGTHMDDFLETLGGRLEKAAKDVSTVTEKRFAILDELNEIKLKAMAGEFL